MSEKTFQKKIIDKYTRAGWFVVKLMQTNKNGIPDVLCLNTKFPARFIEVKGNNGTVSDLQKYRIKELKGFGFDAGVLFEGRNEIIIPDDPINHSEKEFLLHLVKELNVDDFGTIKQFDLSKIINQRINKI